MALKFTQKNPNGSGTGGTYDHSLLVNRGLPDQHTIESITGLTQALARKYEKPMSGIPRSDLAFDVATMTDIDNIRKTDIASISMQLQSVIEEIIDARGDKDTLREYIDSKVSYEDWSGSGGTGSHNGSDVGYPLYQEIFASEGDVTFEFTQTYQMGSKQLEVYLNGLRMILGYDYDETSDSSITFRYPMEQNDHIVAMVRAVISSGLHEEYVAAEDQYRFILQNPYAIYQNMLQVYRNGVLQRKGRDYKELTDYIVEFYSPLIEGDLVTFHQAGSTDPVAGTILETEIGRLKMSNASLAIQLQELSGNEKLYHVDMYTDTFLTKNAFDLEESFDFIHVDNSIQVGLVSINKNTNKEFSEGIEAGVSASSMSNRVVLTNTIGGSEINVFGTQASAKGSKDEVTAYVDVLMPNRSRVEIIAEKKTLSTAYLRIVRHIADGQMNISVINTDVTSGEGKYHNVDHIVVGDVLHIVYTHTLTNNESSVYYMTVTNDEVSTPYQLSTYSDRADNACVHVDDKITVAFDSNRVNPTTRNIDYIVYDSNWSGVRHITSDTVLASEKPCILEYDGSIYVAYETLLIDGINRNIQITRINADGGTESINVTNTMYDNSRPKMALGNDGIIRIAWLSQRLSSNYGVDFIFLYPDGSISGSRTVYSPTSTTRASNVFLNVDSFGISHIAVEANEQLTSITNIVYAFVTEKNVVTHYGNIISHPTDNIKLSGVSLIYDKVNVSGYSETTFFSAEKSIANYLPTGYFTIEFDGLSKDTIWLQFLSEQYTPANTSVSYEIRVSNDRYAWSAWENVSVLLSNNLEGQYAQIRAELKSNYLTTPEILSINLICQPDVIRVQTKPITLSKDIQNVITLADYDGDINFFVSRDGGKTFVEANVDRTTNLLGTPTTQEVVIRAEIRKGSTLKSWAMIW